METQHIAVIVKECQHLTDKIIEENSNKGEKYQFFMLMATLDSIERNFSILKDRLATQFFNENIEVNKREFQKIIMSNAKNCVDSLMRIRKSVRMA